MSRTHQAGADNIGEPEHRASVVATVDCVQQEDDTDGRNAQAGAARQCDLEVGLEHIDWSTTSRAKLGLEWLLKAIAAREVLAYASTPVSVTLGGRLE